MAEEWWPNETQWKNQISKDNWLELLANENVFTDKCKIFLKRLLNIGGEATCADLAKKYGQTASFYIGVEKGLASRILRTKKLHPISDGNREWLFPVLFLGRHVDKTKDSNIGDYIWKLRPELKSALEETGLMNDEKYPLYEIGETKMSDKIEQYKSLLLHTHNIILHGAPGTGKTHLAKEIAQSMGAEWGFVQFHPSYDYTDFVEGLRPVNGDNGQIGFERRDGVFKKFCRKALEDDDETKFNKVYQNLINESINCKKQNKVLSFYHKRKDNNVEYFGVIYDDKEGTLKAGYDKYHIIKEEDVKDLFFGKKTTEQVQTFTYEIFKKIKKDIENYKYVFIIDEINRGEITKIFGELFFSIDPDYRGSKGKISTQYQNLIEDGETFHDGFYIPENVYIIGTMNDIDRSVESMDFAFRRRFTFVELKANENLGMLDELDDSIRDEAIGKMNALNAAISKIEGLSSAYHIGGAYLLKLNDFKDDEIKVSFKNLWKYHLEGLLREYLRGMEDEKDLLESLKGAYENGSNNEVEGV